MCLELSENCRVVASLHNAQWRARSGSGMVRQKGSKVLIESTTVVGGSTGTCLVKLEIRSPKPTQVYFERTARTEPPRVESKRTSQIKKKEKIHMLVGGPCSCSCSCRKAKLSSLWFNSGQTLTLRLAFSTQGFSLLVVPRPLMHVGWCNLVAFLFNFPLFLCCVARARLKACVGFTMRFAMG